MIREAIAHGKLMKTKELLRSEIACNPDRKDETIAEYTNMIRTLARDDHDIADVIIISNNEATGLQGLGFEMYATRVHQENLEFYDEIDHDEALGVSITAMHAALDMKYGGTNGFVAFSSKKQYFKPEFAKLANSAYFTNLQIKNAEQRVMRRSQEDPVSQSGEIFIGNIPNNRYEQQADRTIGKINDRAAESERKEQTYRMILGAFTF